MDDWLKQFKDVCSNLGICEGSLLYVSSDITMLMYRLSRVYGIRSEKEKNEFMHQFVDMFKEMAGMEGTLMFPMFTWVFCHGGEYDVRKTPGETGALGNWILENRKDFKRTAHPLYSFMVAGKDTELLCNMNNKSAWGIDSPFAYLHRAHGKNLLVNVTLERCFTFTHYVEECLKVPYRYFKDFQGIYVDGHGNRERRIYTQFVRDLAIESKQVTPDDCLDKAGAAVSAEYDHNTLKLVDLEKAYPVVVENYLNHNGSDWYDFGGYVFDWKAGQTHPDYVITD
ncbi:MAG: AAC(3) family N-acetyltransferase [Clostridiales bacterium]|nr:AAC(3) family N-acetyltransferase [Clostridiales bacterium]